MISATKTWLAIILLAGPAAAQTLFATQDYRKDFERWADPEYYRHNSVSEIRGMQTDLRYGEEGSGEDTVGINSPYPYETSEEHYEAWLAETDGGTEHDLATLPDWAGRWEGDEGWLGGQQIQASTIAAALTPQYREYFVQQEKAEAEGRHFWPSSFCLPRGFIESIVASPKEFIIRPNRIWIIGDTFTENVIRWVYTDDRGHASEGLQFSKWHGESIGFWDGDALIIHTDQIRAWQGPAIEWSDQLSTIERYQRVGDTILGEINLYDPLAFIAPLHAKFTYEQLGENAADFRPIYNSCTDTNGPSSNVFINAEGALDQRVPGDPLYWDPTIARPWARFYTIGE
jgi:hypothetical protein